MTSMTRPTTSRRPASTTPAADPALALTAVTRAFAGRTVLGPLTLTLDAGTLTVVHGPNGAGKTTLLRVAAGLLTVTAGHRHCPDASVYLRPGGGARHALTIGQALRYTAALAGAADADITAAAASTGLLESTTRRVGELSSGQHARLSVALAAVCSAGLVCLDEPTVHLDTDGVEQIRHTLTAMTRRGTAVLLATHAPEQFRDLRHATLQLTDGALTESPW